MIKISNETIQSTEQFAIHLSSLQLTQ